MRCEESETARTAPGDLRIPTIFSHFSTTFSRIHPISTPIDVHTSRISPFLDQIRRSGACRTVLCARPAAPELWRAPLHEPGVAEVARLPIGTATAGNHNRHWRPFSQPDPAPGPLVPKLRLGTPDSKLRFHPFFGGLPRVSLGMMPEPERSGASALAFPSGAWERAFLEADSQLSSCTRAVVELARIAELWRVPL